VDYPNNGGLFLDEILAPNVKEALFFSLAGTLHSGALIWLWIVAGLGAFSRK
jgi:hypothetical protein